MGRPFRLSSWHPRFPILPAQSLSILRHFPSFPRWTRIYRSCFWTKCTLIRRPPPIWHGSSRHLLASLWHERRSWSNTRSADGATCLTRLAASSSKQTPKTQGYALDINPDGYEFDGSRTLKIVSDNVSEIDFICAPSLTGNPTVRAEVRGRDVLLETPGKPSQRRFTTGAPRCSPATCSTSPAP